MTDVLSLPVLVLNRFMQPLQLTTAKRAMVLLYGGAAHALDEEGAAHDFELWRLLDVRAEDDAIPVIGGAIRVPRIIHLHGVERPPRARVPLSRRNLMARDAHQCQYCGRQPAIRELNIDHVVPRSRGGADTWENLVTSCKPCNLRKGWRTPEEANMKLARKPFRPTWSTGAQILLVVGERFKEWDPFLKAS
jgi:5-methylcytosine-specific restriction endonuclease McrA